MQMLGHIVRRFACDDRGATAIEYGLIAALIAIGALGGMSALGGGLAGSWSNTAEKAATAMNK
jgi:pilus assembly protein Flp/PilA